MGPVKWCFCATVVVAFAVANAQPSSGKKSFQGDVDANTLDVVFHDAPGVSGSGSPIPSPPVTPSPSVDPTLQRCTWRCPRRKSRVCGSDGMSYRNKCYLRRAQCRDPSIEFLHRGRCFRTGLSGDAPKADEMDDLDVDGVDEVDFDADSESPKRDPLRWRFRGRSFWGGWRSFPYWPWYTYPYTWNPAYWADGARVPLAAGLDGLDDLDNGDGTNLAPKKNPQFWPLVASLVVPEVVKAIRRRRKQSEFGDADELWFDDDAAAPVSAAFEDYQPSGRKIQSWSRVFNTAGKIALEVLRQRRRRQNGQDLDSIDDDLPDRKTQGWGSVARLVGRAAWELLRKRRRQSGIDAPSPLDDDVADTIDVLDALDDPVRKSQGWARLIPRLIPTILDLARNRRKKQAMDDWALDDVAFEGDDWDDAFVDDLTGPREKQRRSCRWPWCSSVWPPRPRSRRPDQEEDQQG